MCSAVQFYWHLVSGLLMGTGACAWALPSQTFQVTASIVAGCVVSGSSPGVFGTLNFGRGYGVETRSVSASFVQNNAITPDGTRCQGNVSLPDGQPDSLTPYGPLTCSLSPSDSGTSP